MTAVVKGLRLRVTKTDICGKPIEGAANRIVTDGFIRVNLDPEMKARNDLEQPNAAGDVVVSSSTPPERKWWNTEISLCDVNPDLFSLIATWARVLDHEGKPIGFLDRARPDTDYGCAFELWTGVGDDDGCAPPEDDSIFSASSDGPGWGYFLFVGKEFVSGAIPVEEAITTFTLSGRTVAPKRWGRGPYNVAAIDSSGTPGRLLTPAYDPEFENHIVHFWTPVPPPPVTPGACPLAVQSIFTGPGTPYFGASAAAVAPAQPSCDGGEGE